MPVFALGTGSAAGIARLTRASLLQVIGEDYIRTARAKGLTRAGGDYCPCSQKQPDSGCDHSGTHFCGLVNRNIYRGADLRH